MNPSSQQATAFAPATIANVAVGFDVLGFAFEAVFAAGSEEAVKRVEAVTAVAVFDVVGGIRVQRSALGCSRTAAEPLVEAALLARTGRARVAK